jgi:menaquinone-dependent protoporphyrinogen oxidase
MPNRRAIVIYDSKYGSTEQVANWIAEGVNDADLKYVGDVTSVFYDLVVVGSPIYDEAPSQKIIKFLDRNKDNLANKRVALFTVSVPLGMTPERVKRYTGAQKLKELASHVKGEIIDSRAFLGRIDTKDMSALDRLSLHIQYFLKGYKLQDVDFMSRDEAIAWGRKLINIVSESGTTLAQERRGRKPGGAPPHSTEVKGDGDRHEDTKK